MFTGIVTAIGRVRRVADARRGRRVEFEIAGGRKPPPIGASVACAGCCLTVVAGGKDWFAADVSAETLAKTTLGSWRPGARVNLERPLQMGGELGGHVVAGHVDGVGRLMSRRAEGASIRLVIAVPRALGRFLAPKGSIAVDGVSLTVNQVADGGRNAAFGVNVIPHTARVTTLGTLRRGDRVNVEIDMLARYGARLAETAADGHARNAAPAAAGTARKS
ncbi:MAG: riboflavin synthase [Rhodospirillales bacterium]